MVISRMTKIVTLVVLLLSLNAQAMQWAAPVLRFFANHKKLSVAVATAVGAGLSAAAYQHGWFDFGSGPTSFVPSYDFENKCEYTPEKRQEMRAAITVQNSELVPSATALMSAAIVAGTGLWWGLRTGYNAANMGITVAKGLYNQGVTGYGIQSFKKMLSIV